MLFLLCALSLGNAYFAPLGIVEPTSMSLVKSHGQSTVYALPAQGYDDPYYLVNLKGNSRYELGYAYGYMFHQEIYFNYWALLDSLLNNDTVLIDIAEVVADEQYSKYFSKYLPQDFLDEFQGVTDAGIAVGNPMIGKYVERGFTISTIAVGDVALDILYLLKSENENPKFKRVHEYMDRMGYTHEEMAEEFALKSHRLFKRHCSMWGAWGSRTQNGSLWTGRNLDWASNTGVSTYKTLTVWHAPGKIPYVSVGFAGLTGSITGMSAAGITVHEAGDDNSMETANGFGWALRLRYIMENAADLQTVMALWNTTNNTLGINHGFGSAKDNKFLALETKATYTAYFYANDSREANYQVGGVQYGYPLPEALWRTNHAFDPVWLQTALYPYPDEDTQNRYMLIHDTIVQYQNQSVPMSDWQALNVTAVVGAKGGTSISSFTSCDNASTGSNIISATYLPSKALMYVAFENGRDQNHVPASCNYYVKIDMTQWFQ